MHIQSCWTEKLSNIFTTTGIMWVSILLLEKHIAFLLYKCQQNIWNNIQKCMWHYSMLALQMPNVSMSCNLWFHMQHMKTCERYHFPDLEHTGKQSSVPQREKPALIAQHYSTTFILQLPTLATWLETCTTMLRHKQSLAYMLIAQLL